MNAITRTLGFISRHPLAGKHLIRAYFQLILWQVRTRLSNKLITVPFIGSTKIFAKRGLNGITGNIYTGLHEFEEMAFLLHLLRDTDTFFDVGANVGSFTILASGVCRSKTISFEPVPETFEILLKNIDLNKIANRVKLINAAAGNEQKSIRFTTSQDATNHAIPDCDFENEGIMVSVVQLDEFRLEIPLLLKIDVEGFETEVLRGAGELLNQESLKAIIVELNGSGERYDFDDEQIHRQLKKLGFRPYQYEPFQRNLTELDHYGKFNTLYLRDIPFISKRIKSAKPFKVFSRLI